MNKKLHPILIFVSLLVLFSLVMSGCAQPTQAPAPEEPAAPAEEVEEVEEVEEPAEPAEQEAVEEPAEEEMAEEAEEAPEAEEQPEEAPPPVDAGGPIVVTWWSEPNNVDPHTFGTDGDSDARLQGFSTLIAKKMEPGPYPDTWVGITGDYEPVMAESWEENDDGSWTFKLKEDIVYSNGETLTASDVAYTVERGMLSPTSYMAGLLTLAGIDDPAQVEVVDDYTVKFNIKPGASPIFLELLSELNMVILDKETLDTHATEEDPWATEWAPLNMVGTGPYVLEKVEPGVEFIYGPSPTHYDAANYPKNDGIVIKVIPTAADRILLLKQGEVDVLRGIPYSEIEDLEADPDIDVLIYPSIDTRNIALNHNVAPFDDVAVRQAISYAIPYDDILDVVWAGHATQLKSVIPEGMPTSDSSFYPFEYDPEKAKTLLAEAGYPDGFETTLFARADNQDDQDIAVIVQDALREIGVTVNIESLLSAAYAERQTSQRDMPMFFFDLIMYVNDPFYTVYWQATCGGFINYANSCDPEIDRLYQEGLFEPDPAVREEISKEIQKLHVESAPWLFLAQPDSVTAVRSDIKGWAEFPDRIARYWTLYRVE